MHSAMHWSFFTMYRYYYLGQDVDWFPQQFYRFVIIKPSRPAYLDTIF